MKINIKVPSTLRRLSTVIDNVKQLTYTTVGSIAQYHLLDLPAKITIAFSDSLPINTMGRADPANNVIEINPLLTSKEFTDTLIHELIHLEQNHVGWTTISDKADEIKWLNKLYKIPKTDKEYATAPWEVDARRRLPVIRRELNHALQISMQKRVD